MTSLLLRHVLLPATAPAAVIGLYFTPVLLFGCVNRSLLTLAVVLISAGVAFATILLSARECSTWSGRHRLRPHIPTR